MTSLQRKSLREARLSKSVSIEEIAGKLDIDSIYLEAIENEEFSTLPPLYAKGYIRTYARFLEVDSAPILQAYKESTPEQALVLKEESSSTSLLSRKKRVELSQTKKKSKKKWIGKISSIGWPIWTALGLIILVIPLLVWWLLPNDKQTVVHSINPSPDSSDSSTTSETAFEQLKSSRAEVKLIQPSETYEYGDVYGISKSDQVHVKVTAIKPTEIRVRENGPQGKIIFEKELQLNQTEEFTHDQWISLRVNHPSHISLSVNGVTIDTTEEKEIKVYQLKVVK